EIDRASPPDGAVTVAASGPVALVAAVDDGSSFVYSDGAEIEEAGGAVADLGSVGEAPVGLAVFGHQVVIAVAAGFFLFDIDDVSHNSTSLTALDVNDGALAGVAVEGSGDFVFAAAHAIVEVPASGGPERRLVDVPSPFFPYVGTSAAPCTGGGIAALDDDVLVLDRCTGALVRVALGAHDKAHRARNSDARNRSARAHNARRDRDVRMLELCGRGDAVRQQGRLRGE
ncbi:MAG TPA: hypothetical protein VGO62_15625, partial [Myxococcota bacterium]